MNPLDRQIAEAEAKLCTLLHEVHNTDIFERARLYVAKFSNGRPLSEWIHDEKVPAKDRATVSRTLVEILLTKQYDRLPLPAQETPVESKATARPAPAVTPSEEPPAVLTADEIRALVHKEVQFQLAKVFETVARVLRE